MKINKFKKRAVIVHCWEGYPEYCWYPQTKKELEAAGFEVFVPAMPETDNSKLSLWFPKLQEVIGNPDENLYLIGHSIGCATILRYLENIDEAEKIGGAVFVAGFTENPGYDEIRTFFDEPFDFEKIKIFVLLSLARLSGSAGIHLILQAIEIHGIKKYLSVWETYKNDPLGKEIKNILEDEFKHEDEIVSSAKRTKIYPERVRDIFLGFNDGLVEILGAVSGFFAAFENNISVLIAALTVAVAGSISMAASAFASQSSQKEVEDTETGKKIFLGEKILEVRGASPLRSATIVGIFYFFGSL